MEEMRMNEEDKFYMEQMESWLKEQQAREKEIRTTIETSSEIAKQNKIQLEFHLKAYNKALKEYQEWLKEKGIELKKTQTLDMFVFRNKALGCDSAVIAENEKAAWKIYFDLCPIGTEAIKCLAKIEKQHIEDKCIAFEPMYVMSMPV